MGKKFGKKNVIKIDPLAYNTAVIGESGIGKTTLAKMVCEKLVGEDGYIIANVGKEDGIDAISGAIYEDIEDWDIFSEFCDDIIENKLEDYPDLRVIVWDTIDELIRIGEPEAIRRYNKQLTGKTAKQARTIKQAWGGFGEGEKYTVNMIMDKLWELKKAGVMMFLLGHTKVRTKSDPVTGEDYDMLTTNMSYSSFNAFKTKLHFLGVASINREIVREKTGKKDIVTKAELEKGKIDHQERRITFRDDNFNIDSKSRFEDIVEHIPLNADAFIKALTDAISAEANKDVTDKTFAERAKEQKAEEHERVKEKVENKKNEREVDAVIEIQQDIAEFISENKLSSPQKLKPLLIKMKELGYIKPSSIDNIEDAMMLKDLI